MAQASIREIIFKGQGDLQEQRSWKLGQAKNFAVRFPFQASLRLSASKFSVICCRWDVMVYCECIMSASGTENV